MDSCVMILINMLYTRTNNKETQKYNNLRQPFENNTIKISKTSYKQKLQILEKIFHIKLKQLTKTPTIME